MKTSHHKGSYSVPRTAIAVAAALVPTIAVASLPPIDAIGVTLLVASFVTAGAARAVSKTLALCLAGFVVAGVFSASSSRVVWSFVLFGLALEMWRTRVGMRALGSGGLAQLHEMLNGIPSVVAMKDADGRYTFINDAYERIVGKSRTEVIGRTVFDIFPADQARQRDEHDRIVLTERRAMETEETLRVKSGELHTFLTIKFPTLGSDGKPTGTFLLATDIEDRVRAALELKQSEERFERIAAAARVGVWELNLITQELYLAPGLRQLLGYSEEELPATLDAWCRLVHPEDKDRVIDATEAYLKGDADRYEVEVRRLHKSGEYRWFVASGTKLVNQEGIPTRMFGSDTEITERKRIEEALRESEERLRLGLLAGNTGTWDWDIVTGAVKWSEQLFEIHGVTPHEFAGAVEDFQRLIHPDDLELVSAAIERSLREGAPYQVEFRAIRPDGEIRWIATTGKVYFSADGRPQRMLGATSDVTQRRVAEEHRNALLQSERSARSEAERANRLKDEFLATLSHELRTPLNAILGWAQLMQRRLNDQETIAQGIETIERNARAQSRIVSDLLDMSRIVSGKLVIKCENTDLRGLLEGVLETVRPEALLKDVVLTLTIPDPLPSLWLDRERFQQVFWNLVANAIKFSPPSGLVSVHAAKREGHVDVFVRDEGEGIPADFEPFLFDAFRQADSSITRRYGGLGLGLSIVKKIVEAHKGTVQIVKGTQKGAEFCVSLPISPRADTTQPGVEEVDATLEGLSVLVVDDEADAREIVARLILDRGATVSCAGSAREALEMAHESRFDVIVSDIGMPDEDGFWLLRQLTEQLAVVPPCIALTAYAREEDKVRALEAGYFAHLAKPVGREELLTNVRDAASSLHSAALLKETA